jgi:HAMP domain-containing protein
VDSAARAYILARLERLHTLLNQLDKATNLATRPVWMRMRRELNAAKKAVRRIPANRPKNAPRGDLSR